MENKQKAEPIKNPRTYILTQLQAIFTDANIKVPAKREDILKSPPHLSNVKQALEKWFQEAQKNPEQQHMLPVLAKIHKEVMANMELRQTPTKKDRNKPKLNPVRKKRKHAARV